MKRSRWMTLKYAGKCAQCEKVLPVGATAYYDGDGDRSTTCTTIECAETKVMTEQKWVGSPVSGQWVTKPTDIRRR